MSDSADVSDVDEVLLSCTCTCLKTKEGSYDQALRFSIPVLPCTAIPISIMQNHFYVSDGFSGPGNLCVMIFWGFPVSIPVFTYAYM